MYARILIVVLSILLTVLSTRAATVDYRIDRLLEAGDPLWTIEDEVLTFRGSSDEYISATRSRTGTNNQWKVEDAYRCLRMYYQQLQTLLWQRIERGNTVDKTTSELDKRIQNVTQNYRSCAETLGNSFPRTPQIVELTGDLAYFNPATGKNAALILHYKAYCLGLRSESILRKIALDLKVMYSSFDWRTQASDSVNRKAFLFALDKKTPDFSDRDTWLAMAQWFDKMATRTNVVMNARFNNWWDELYRQSRTNSSDTKLVMAGLAILYEQLARYEAELLARAERDGQVSESQIKADKIDEERKTGMAQSLGTLKCLATLPNSLEKIELVLSGLNRYRSELNKAYKDIPGYDALKTQYAGTEEAEVLNLFYAYSVKKDYEAVLKQIHGLKTAETDNRILFLDFFCQSKLDRDIATLNKCIDRILKLDPSNRRAKHIRIELEGQAQPSRSST